MELIGEFAHWNILTNCSESASKIIRLGPYCPYPTGSAGHSVLTIAWRTYGQDFFQQWSPTSSYSLESGKPAHSILLYQIFCQINQEGLKHKRVMIPGSVQSIIAFLYKNNISVFCSYPQLVHPLISICDQFGLAYESVAYILPNGPANLVLFTVNYLKVLGVWFRGVEAGAGEMDNQCKLRMWEWHFLSIASGIPLDAVSSLIPKSCGFVG